MNRLSSGTLAHGLLVLAIALLTLSGGWNVASSSTMEGYEAKVDVSAPEPDVGSADRSDVIVIARRGGRGGHAGRGRRGGYAIRKGHRRGHGGRHGLHRGRGFDLDRHHGRRRLVRPHEFKGRHRHGHRRHDHHFFGLSFYGFYPYFYPYGYTGSYTYRTRVYGSYGYVETGVSEVLEKNPTGQTSVWVNPDTGREVRVTPGPATREPPYCREFTKDVVVAGGVESAYGRACRQPDGSWKISN